MYRIGEFSRIASVTIETLRHYDALGLLKPAQVDAATGYRYYNAGQLQTLNQIIALKEVGLSLEEIVRILRDNLTLDELRGLLKAQLTLTESAIEAAQLRRQRLLVRLQSLERENMPPEYEVSLKAAEALTVAAMRETIPTPEQIPQRWNELFSAIAAWMKTNGLPVGIPLPLYHDDGYRGENIDTECAFTIPGIGIERVPAPASPIVVRQMTAIPQVATLVVANFHQKVEGLKPAYAALGQWVATNGYHITAAPRELYYGSPQTGDFTAEIQFPVEKSGSTG
ncbi:MAG TPA: MerR family transcriptional regulator [Phototrophicaceae bacterium]|nr:MerR family transcriptional regulator [Phototrophicaceae bacterium]